MEDADAVRGKLPPDVLPVCPTVLKLWQSIPLAVHALLTEAGPPDEAEEVEDVGAGGPDVSMSTGEWEWARFGGD